MLRQARYQNGIQAYQTVLDILFHIPNFAKVILTSEPIDVISTEADRNAFAELKNIVSSIINSNSSTENINLSLFFQKLKECNYTEYSKNVDKTDNIDILLAYDDIIKLIISVIPPLREVFIGHNLDLQTTSIYDSKNSITSLYDNNTNSNNSDYSNINTRLFRAHYSNTLHNLDDIIKTCYKIYTSSSPIAQKKESIVSSNINILKRSPEILLISIESAHIRSNVLSSVVNTDKAPSFITYPDHIDITYMFPELTPTTTTTGSVNEEEEDESKYRIYDLTAVSVVEGPNFGQNMSYFRLPENPAGNSGSGQGGLTGQDHWYRNAG